MAVEDSRCILKGQHSAGLPSPAGGLSESPSQGGLIKSRNLSAECTEYGHIASHGTAPVAATGLVKPEPDGTTENDSSSPHLPITNFGAQLLKRNAVCSDKRVQW